MADATGADTPGAPVPGAPTGGPATPPGVAVPLALYTVGRVLITAALVTIIWVAGLPGFPALLFGLLLSMPVSHVLLRGVRDRLTDALAARSIARRTAREELRARLSGDADDDV
ncbi:DUF4229 domain-containing protein [Blastococcus sp. TF02A-26]|uniref:DUF4229 domain-containing protein n=1 Tax=Blastococcus sp. TF02A-26 TaxID=2250577 RepID=UPI000DEA0AFB|nr:DUF4229 domain-containing protein [Blastococcus sp. TF02A-26]RBY82311.1 DUF4229 domain-containing protein [Blastococcus sp. TF02A-26]